MKAYLFNVENGLYEGETFVDTDMLAVEDGITPVPAPDYEHGQVPVFDCKQAAWTVMPINIVRQRLNMRQADSTEN